MASITFGSVGDIVTVCGLVRKAIIALSKSRGSSAQYRELLKEIDSLGAALQSVSTVLEGDPHVTGSQQLRDALSRCYTCLNLYLGSIRKYDEALKKGGSSNPVKDSVRKLQWHASQHEISRFRAEISAHVQAIGIQLATHNIQANTQHQNFIKNFIESKFAAFTAADENRNLLLQLDATLSRRMIRMQDTFENTFRALSTNSAGDDAVELTKFESLIDRLEALLTQQGIPQKLGKTWQQEPMVLEDALNRVFPIHLDFISSWDSFLFVLNGHFKDTAGEGKVARKEFLLFDQTGCAVSFHKPWHEAFTSGQRVSMAMLFTRRRVSRSSCPLCLADNDDPTDCEVQCKECHTKYTRIVEVGSDLNDEPGSPSLASTAYKHRFTQGSESSREERNTFRAQEEEVEPSHELHAFKRLVLRAQTSSESDLVSERAITNLMNYNLAGDRAEAMAMLLAKSQHLSLGDVHPREVASDVQGITSEQNSSSQMAVIRMQEVDNSVRKGMGELISLAEGFLQNDHSTSEPEIGPDDCPPLTSQYHVRSVSKPEIDEDNDPPLTPLHHIDSANGPGILEVKKPPPISFSSASASTRDLVASKQLIDIRIRLYFDNSMPRRQLTNEAWQQLRGEPKQWNLFWDYRSSIANSPLESFRVIGFDVRIWYWVDPEDCIVNGPEAGQLLDEMYSRQSFSADTQFWTRGDGNRRCLRLCDLEMMFNSSKIFLKIHTMRRKYGAEWRYTSNIEGQMIELDIDEVAAEYVKAQGLLRIAYIPDIIKSWDTNRDRSPRSAYRLVYDRMNMDVRERILMIGSSRFPLDPSENEQMLQLCDTALLELNSAFGVHSTENLEFAWENGVRDFVALSRDFNPRLDGLLRHLYPGAGRVEKLCDLRGEIEQAMNKVKNLERLGTFRIDQRKRYERKAEKFVGKIDARIEESVRLQSRLDLNLPSRLNYSNPESGLAAKMREGEAVFQAVMELIEK